jgi:hypothetical protein
MTLSWKCLLKLPCLVFFNDRPWSSMDNADIWRAYYSIRLRYRYKSITQTEAYVGVALVRAGTICFSKFERLPVHWLHTWNYTNPYEYIIEKDESKLYNIYILGEHPHKQKPHCFPQSQKFRHSTKPPVDLWLRSWSFIEFFWLLSSRNLIYFEVHLGDLALDEDPPVTFVGSMLSARRSPDSRLIKNGFRNGTQVDIMLIAYTISLSTTVGHTLSRKWWS